MYTNIKLKDLLDILKDENVDENIPVCFGKAVTSIYIPKHLQKLIYKKTFGESVEVKH